jgi:hypothetical protein
LETLFYRSAFVKLHTLKQSLFVSLLGSFISVPMGADRLDTEQPQAAGMDAVAIRGGETVDKPNRVKITNDAEFIEALNDMNRTELLGSDLATVMADIKTFLDQEPRTLSLDSCQKALNNLMIVSGKVDRIYVDKLLSAKRSNQWEITTYCLDSGLTRIFSYLQKVTKGIIKKVNSQNLNLLVEKYGIKMFCSDLGVLYILQDKNNEELPLAIGKDHLNRDKDIAFIVNYGDFLEGVGSRAIAYVDKRLVTMPGLFLERNKNSLQVTIYQGSPKGTVPFRACSVRSSLRNDPIERHDLYPIFETLSPKAKMSKPSDPWARFIPMSDYYGIKELARHLIEHNAISGSEAFLSVLSFLSELMSREEERQTAIAKQRENKPAPKKSKSKSNGSRKKPQGVAHTSAEADSRMTNDVVVAATDDTAAEEMSALVIPASAAAPDEDEGEESFAVDPSNALSAAAPDDSDEEETAGTSGSQDARMTKEQIHQIHQSLYDQVMATVPEGRINQRVLNQLIGEWLKKSQVPFKKLQVFARGSHTTLHGGQGGVSLVRRHNGRDYAPGEVRRLAERVVGLAAQ